MIGRASGHYGPHGSGSTAGETTYQFRAPFVIDSSKLEAAFGRLQPTPHRDAVQLTVAWCRSR